MRLIWRWFALAVLGSMVSYLHAQDTLVFGNRHAKGKITNVQINEASGLVASAAYRNHFWTHNDSGDKARVFLIDDSARHRATFYLEGVDARDWEDIGMMERDGRHYLLVGDIGDNRGRHPHVTIHVFEEPRLGNTGQIIDTIPAASIHSFVLQYEDGPRDAESLFFDPLDKRLYVISKRELEVGVYSAALTEQPTDTLILRKQLTLPYTYVTAADISPDGSEVLMKNLLMVLYWKRKPGESIIDMFKRPAQRQPYIPEPQGEAITFARDGNGYYTLSEAALGMDAILYFYERNKRN